jgi:hypothetical protein
LLPILNDSLFDTLIEPVNACIMCVFIGFYF